MRTLRFCGKVFFVLCCLLALFLGAIQLGLADGLLTGRLRAVLVSTVGSSYIPRLEGASIRFGSDGRVAVIAEGVRFLRAPGSVDVPVRAEGRNAAPADTESPVPEPAVLTSAERVRLVLDPVPLLSGRIEPAAIEIEGATVDARLARAGGDGMNWDAVRIDAIDDLVERAFVRLDRIRRSIAAGNAQSFAVTDARITGLGRPLSVVRFEAGLSPERNLVFESTIMLDGREVALNGTGIAHSPREGLDEIRLSAEGPLLLSNGAYQEYAADGPEIETKQRFGLESEARITFEAHRTPAAGSAQIEADVAIAPGRLTMGGEETRLKESSLALAYLPDAQKIEILQSELAVADTRIPFTGGAIDISNLEDMEGRGIAFEAIVADARAAPTDSAEAPLPFNGKISGRFLKHRQEVVFDEIQIDSPAGTLFASAGLKFGDTSPQISLAARFARMETAGLKQLWPFWIAKRPREWVQKNLFAGTATDGALNVFVPEGQMAAQPGHLDLDAEQLTIDFDFSGSRLGVAGDIPPLRETQGRFELAGSRMDVVIDRASGYFPSGRRVEVAGSTLTIADTHARPLMADLNLKVSGTADAAAELISYRPIDVLSRLGYAADDFSGNVRAEVNARFGLAPEQDPPPPDYDVDMTLESVDIAKSVQGRMLSDISGELNVTPERAVLDAAAAVDGVPVDIALTQPIGKDSPVQPSREVTGTLSEEDRARLLAGLNGVLQGPLDFSITQVGEGEDRAEIDLSAASLTVPGLNWKKAAGIAANASFLLKAGEEGQSIENFALSGEGFSASGSMELGEGGLRQARFENVRLSPRDDFAVTLQRDGAGAMTVDVTGNSLDLRSLIENVRKGAAGGASGGGASVTTPVKVDADLKTVHGFNGETLDGFSARYEGAGADVRSLEASGVTESGAAVVLSIAPAENGSTLVANAADLGAVTRFTDIYGRISGGIVDLQLSKTGDGPYRGTVRVADFAVIDEAQLDALVSARAAGGNRSLNDALRGRIDTSAARFDRGFARIAIGPGGVSVADGVVRGPQIGTTFDGVVTDANGNMDITGTFMPAYGLNRLVAEIPLFGQLLGNGRDRGLIGITFRLAGKVSDPQLTVNPISVMAPGIFREIFEF